MAEICAAPSNSEILPVGNPWPLHHRRVSAYVVHKDDWDLHCLMQSGIEEAHIPTHRRLCAPWWTDNINKLLMKRAKCELCQLRSPRVHVYPTKDPQPRAQKHKSLDQVLMKIGSEIAHMHHPKNCTLYWVLVLMMAFPFHLKVFSFAQVCLDFDNIFFQG
jgi:hypothetical protein